MQRTFSRTSRIYIYIYIYTIVLTYAYKPVYREAQLLDVVGFMKQSGKLRLPREWPEDFA